MCDFKQTLGAHLGRYSVLHAGENYLSERDQTERSRVPDHVPNPAF